MTARTRSWQPVRDPHHGLPAKRCLKPPSTTAVHAASPGALLAGPATRGATTSSKATASPAVSPEGAQDRFRGGRVKRASFVTPSGPGSKATVSPAVSPEGA